MDKEINLVWDFKKYPQDYIPMEQVEIRELQLPELKPEPEPKKKKAQ